MKWSVWLALFLMVGSIVAGCGSSAKKPVDGGTSPSTGGTKPTIVVGIWGTITGPDSDASGDAFGSKDYFDYLNEKEGGILGHKVNAILLDGKASLDEEVKNFKRFVDSDKAVVINGWSTGSTKALRNEVNIVKKVPFLSKSVSIDVVNPKEIPYNFIVGPTYEDQIKIAMNWAKSQGAKTFAFLHNDAEYGTAPTSNVEKEKYAESIGLQLVANIAYPFSTKDLTSQLLALKDKNPDYVYVQDSVNNVVTLLRDAKKVGIPASKFIGNYLGYSPVIPQTVGDAANGWKAIQFMETWGADFPGMKAMQEWSNTHKVEKKDIYYVKGWVEAMLMAEGIKKAIVAAGGTAPSDIAKFRTMVRDGMESIQNLDVGGAVPPVTYLDHQGVTRAKIAEVKNGKYEAITDWINTKK